MKPRHVYYALALAVFVVGCVAGNFLVAFVGGLLGIVGIAIAASNSETKALRAAPKGAQRIKVVKQAFVNSTIQKYAREGWTLADQSSAKSLGSQARITLTFRKG